MRKEERCEREKTLFFFLFLFFLSCRRLHFLIPLRLIGTRERKSCCTPWFSFFAGGNRKMGLLVISPPPELCLKYAEITQKPRVQREINGASLPPSLCSCVSIFLLLACAHTAIWQISLNYGGGRVFSLAFFPPPPVTAREIFTAIRQWAGKEISPISGNLSKYC